MIPVRRIQAVLAAPGEEKGCFWAIGRTVVNTT